PRKSWATCPRPRRTRSCPTKSSHIRRRSRTTQPRTSSISTSWTITTGCRASSHRLTGDEYGFESLSFIISETHPGGGPGLHVHDTEAAHVLLEGTAQYRIGDKTFTVHGPYVGKVPAGVPHTFINAGSKPFNLI